MKKTTANVMKNSHFSRTLLAGVAAGALVLAGCTGTTVPTPTRVLDRPSDAALFCVDYEYYSPQDCPVGATLLPPPQPQGGVYNATDDQNYINNYCNVTIDPTLTPRAVTVLAPQECDTAHRDNQIAALRDAAQRLGLDPNQPCCALNDDNCGAVVPSCVSRTLAAVVSNSNTNEVAVIDTQAVTPGLSTRGSIVNLQNGRPGFGFLPVGAIPEHIRSASTDFIVNLAQNPPRLEARTSWAVTANAGSCDFSLINLIQVGGLLADPIDCSGATAGAATSCPTRIVPYAVSPDKPLGARPAWVEVLPISPALNQTSPMRVVAAFPTCGLVADIDLSTGQIKEAVQFDGTGKASLVTNVSSLSCPADCGQGAGGAGLMIDTPDGGVVPVGSSPSSVAVDDEYNEILISDSRTGLLTLLDYDAAAGVEPRFQPPQQFALNYSDIAGNPRGLELGVDVVRVGPRTSAGKFAYLAAHDASVRVFDLDHLRECETNPDPRWLQQQATLGPGRVLPDDYNDPTQTSQANVGRFSCFPIGTPRTALALSPGIPLPGGALPRDIAFEHLDIGCDPSDPACPYNPATTSALIAAGPLVWVGDFAWILGSNGVLSAVQVADACPGPSFRACFPAQAMNQRAALLRTIYPGLVQDVNTVVSLPEAVWVTPQDRLGNVRRPESSRFDVADPGPRVVAATDTLSFIASTFGATDAVTGYVQDPKDPLGTTRLRQVLPAPQSFSYLPIDPVCDVTLQDPASQSLGSPTVLTTANRPQTIASFPNPQAVITNETWYVEWEGILPTLNRTTGRLISDSTLLDQGGLYCDRGVEDGDKLWLTGCSVDSDCDSGQQCLFEPSRQGGQPGICLPGQQQAQVCQTLSGRLTVDQGPSVWAASWTPRYRIVKAEQQVTGSFPITPPPNPPAGTTDSVDRLTLAEIDEPEFEIEQTLCDEAHIGQPCGDAASVHVLLQNSTNTTIPDSTTTTVKATTCRADMDNSGQKIYRCVVECQSTADCGYNFVCAHSMFDDLLERDDKIAHNPRCMRAPLVAAGAAISDARCLGDNPNQNCIINNMTSTGTGFRPMNQGEADSILNNCFPNTVHYTVRGGDAFLVHGSQSGAPSPELVVNGACQRPTLADGAALFQYSRLYQPRLRLGPRSFPTTPDPTLPVCSGNWISHHVYTNPSDFPTAPSCELAFGYHEVPPPAVLGSPYPPNTLPGLPPNTLPENATVLNGQDMPSGKGLVGGELTLPDNNNSNLWVAQASWYLAQAQANPTLDPALNMESDLFGVLQLNEGNRCFLDPVSETLSYPGLSECSAASSTCICPDGNQPPCARRIHFENQAMNLVMEVPRNQLPLPILTTTQCQVNTDCAAKTQQTCDPTTHLCIQPTLGDEWQVPPEGYTISFQVSGGYQPYTVNAESGAVNQLAQGLHAATQAPDGSIFIVDEGRTSSTTGLRGQILRIYRQGLDGSFLIR